MYKIFLFLYMCVFVTATNLYAGPSSPDPFEIQQPDGNFIRARNYGDEFQNWTESEESGHTILKNRFTGYWEYAEQLKDGTLRPNGIRVLPKGLNSPSATSKGLRPPRNIKLEQSMQQNLHDIYQQRINSVAETLSNSDDGVVTDAALWNPSPVSGNRKILLIMVNFSDRSLITTPDSWNTSVFSTLTGVKSVANYYKDNSFNNLLIIPVSHTQNSGSSPGVVSVSVNMPHPYNGTEESTWVSAAINAASTYVDFFTLDANNNGYIDRTEAIVYLIPAGYEDSGGSQTPNVWAHATTYSSGGLLAAGKRFPVYALNGELTDSNTQHPMGVIAHELGHQMCGLPDLYDTSGFNAGLGNFSLMAGGSWGKNIGEAGGTTPTSLDAWSREYLGWSTPIVPDMSSPISPFILGRQLSNPSTPYKLIIPSTSSSEYFLLENRFPSGWDLGLKGLSYFNNWQGGLLIIHVDNNAGSKINDYTNNVGNRQGVVAVQASTAICNMLTSGSASSCRGNPKTLFYSGNNTNLTPSSTPNSNYYNGTSTNLFLNAITAPGNEMTAEFSYGPLTVPGAPNIGPAIRGNSQASVSFSAPSYDGGSAITNYTVTSSPGGFTASAASSPIAVTGLANGTIYSFTVKATNINGNGPSSSASNSVTPATIPSSPQNVIASRGNGQVSVSFSAPVSNGGSTITNYTVTASPGDYIGIGGASPVVVTGLSNGTSYSFTVTATNSVGTGPSSPSFSPVTPATIPGPPSINTVTIGSGQAAISFAVPGSDGGSTITSYKATSSGGQQSSSAVSPIVMTGLTDGIEYTFTVVAMNGVGDGSASISSGSVTPGVVRNSGFYSKGYIKLQDAYNEDTDSDEIQIVADTPVGPFVKDDSATIIVKGGFDTSFSSSNGQPAILSSVILKKGKTIFKNVVIKP